MPLIPGINPDGTFESVAVRTGIDSRAAAKVASDMTSGGTPVASAVSAVVEQASRPQGDYVEQFARLSSYETLTVKKLNTNNGIEVKCEDAAGIHHVRYIFTDRPRYQYVGEVWATSESGPPAPVFSTRFPDLVTTGTFGGTTATPFTSQVGATWTAQFTTTGPDATVYFSSYTDARGGVWRISLVEAPAVTADVSTWNATVSVRSDRPILTIPEAGTYTIRGEFMGDDPANAPTNGAGTSRGWLLAADSNFPLIRVDSVGGVATVQLSPKSNKDFAVSLKPTTGGAYEFVPYHGTDSEREASAPVYLLDGRRIDVAGMAANATVQGASFEIVQNIYGRNSANLSLDLIDLRTKQRITANGVYSVEGQWRTLTDVYADEASYVMMMMGNGTTFTELDSSLGNAYPNTPAKIGGVTWLEAESDKAVSYALLSEPVSDQAIAVRYNNPTETVRMGADNKREPSRRVFLEHRSVSTVKLYNRLFGKDVLLPAGWSHRFSGDYFYGRIPAVHDVTARL